VRSSRLDGVSGLDSGVLELQRIADLPRRAPLPPVRHKLRPFGPPLPSRAQLAAEAAAAEAELRSRGGGWGGGWAGPAGSGEEAAMWRDAAAASAEASDGAGGGSSAAGSEQVVFDVYELVNEETAGGLVGEDAAGGHGEAEVAECDDGGPGAFERIWWEEIEDDLVTDPDGGEPGSGSEGEEVDYPEDEESERMSASSEGEETDEDAGPRRRYNFQL
jgi:hypothetical protein